MRQKFDIRPMTGGLGAEIFGVDLAQSLSDDLVAEIRQAFLDHLVIFFREQEITDSQFQAFAERFGEPVEYPFVKGIEGFPKIIPVLKKENETVNFGGVWHSDTTYQAEPPMGTMLYALDLPPVGGDTLYANQYLAWESLSDGMRGLLDGLSAFSEAGKAAVTATRADRRAETGTAVSETLRAEHPVARTHPETGRKALFVNVAHTTRFSGMSEEESTPILNYLFQHQVRQEFCCRFRWAPGSLAFWDNRCAQHYPVNDYHGHRRELHRITLAGDKPC